MAAGRKARQPLREPTSSNGDRPREGPLGLPLEGGQASTSHHATGCHAAAIFSISQPGCGTFLPSSAGVKAVCTISGR